MYADVDVTGFGLPLLFRKVFSAQTLVDEIGKANWTIAGNYCILIGYIIRVILYGNNGKYNGKKLLGFRV